MYPTLLFLHSMFRWLVLLTLLYALYQAYRGWLAGKIYSKKNDLVRLAATATAHLQLVAGILLYFTSPIVNYFLSNFEEAVHVREVRFLGMEHAVMMLIAIIVITVGSYRTKRKKSDRNKFKTLAIWFSIALILILVAIPWPFSPMSSRPLFRAF